ncbi:hypothetical protein [Halomonas rhizosphaerae]|uniref:DUF1275 domain-containing protein n=1 Tax=Halomonas rhizosphaerae TaxID=3043296 RepID=A0ABT6V4B6_9GAMM|nr:hypothetical protein [Halomonas rhizosphaerae]MDI5893069.1 hypothetical protein [Halomonas rhizosphaerae]
MLRETAYFGFLFIVIISIVLTADLGGDRGYVLRLVQNGGDETVYLLIGATLGLVLRDAPAKDGRLALMTAVAAAFSGMFLSAFNSLESTATWLAAVMLVTFFFTCLFLSVVHTFEALKKGARSAEPSEAPAPRFVRTPPPRRR